MNIILLGAPGSGKGTQSALLGEKFGIPCISTGNILREACRQKTETGQIAEDFLKRGLLVPDELVIRIVRERITQPDCRSGYILDGFPRTIKQAETLTAMLGEWGDRIDAVVNFQVTDEELIKRLAGRRLCEDCGTGYHLFFAPPKSIDACDRCGGSLFQRDDDREETITRRLHVYLEQTSPLINYYEKEGLLRNVKGIGETTQIFSRVIAELEAAA